MRPLRVANCSGFYGDRFAAAREMLDGGPIDVLTGDYLAELTMLILAKAREKDPEAGYAVTFLRQMEDILSLALEKGVKIVSNAGGLNPAGLALRLRELSDRLGLGARVAYVEGDDLLGRLDELEAAAHGLEHAETGRPLSDIRKRILTANAYIGAWGIVEGLRSGADVVVCPRVTDASLVVGPAAWHFGWDLDDWDRLAGATVAGHIVECGPQAAGGNYAFFQEVPNLSRPGFPIVEIHDDGSFVVTKHARSGGLVSTETVTAQLLYEVAGPDYLGPDATAFFDTIQLEQEGVDRVRVHGVQGAPPPPTLKVGINYLGGYRNSMTFVLTGLDIDEKAEATKAGILELLGGAERFEELTVQLLRFDKQDPPTNEEASAFLRVIAKDSDPGKVGRAFSSALIEMSLAGYPGLYTTTPPQSESSYGVFWPTTVPASLVEEVVVTHDGARIAAPKPPHGRADGPARALVPIPAAPSGPTRRVPLGRVLGARSGDKGGNANVGVWARGDQGYAWAADYLTVERFKQLVPEAADLEVRRYELPNLRALNFVVVGLLGEGVAASVRFDPQAKSLGEYLRAKVVDVPVAVLEE